MRLSSLYECGCDDCKINLAASPDKKDFKSVLKAAENAFKHLHEKGGYKAEDINDKPYQKLISETNNVLSEGLRDNVIPPAMMAKMENDTFIFSGLKTHAQLLEANSFLRDEKGQIRNFDAFAYEFNKVNEKYNQNYLEAEHSFALRSSQMAANWAATDPDGRYNLQYRTANDDRVRENHRALQDITLPKEDSFWLSYYPPNGWRCRCTAVEVRKSKFELSDSEKAIQAGEKATSQIGKDGKNKLEIFRFNPGAEQKVFPPKHPYNKVKDADVVKEKMAIDTLKLSELIKGETPTNEEIKNIILEYSEKFPTDFSRGLSHVKIQKSSSYLMQHSMSYSPATNEWVGKSTITLSSHEFTVKGEKFNPLEEIRGAFSSIKKGEKLSYKQEISIESLWHEILHAKSKTPPQNLSQIQVKTMETVNEFIARQTYDSFLEKLGGKAAHKNSIIEESYGYDEWIKDFRNELKYVKATDKEAVEALMPHLMKDYETLSVEKRKFLRAKQSEQ